MMLVTAPTVEETAARIERAYLRRHPEWRAHPVPARAWGAAAELLFELHQGDPSLPLDPELFVAAQARSRGASDPWADLTRGGAARRYRRRVDRIVRALRAELCEELRLIERRLAEGEPAESALSAPSRSLSALGRYVAAHRAGRPDLGESFRAQAEGQHRGCPLYRRACAGLIPASSYPVPEVVPGLVARLVARPAARPFSLN